MSYAEAAEAEASFEDTEAERSLDGAERQNETLRDMVSLPRRQLLEKVRSNDECISQLTDSLSEAEQSSHTKRAQAEGDEEPELLEQLTLLKWLFESREHLHKELFELESLQTDKEHELALLHQKHDGDPHDTQYFEQRLRMQTQDRQIEYIEQAHQRFTILQYTIERNVSRGVEVQISAFWDIAPSILDIVHEIPDTLLGFEVEVPQSERQENPSYLDFPEQYLFTVLTHASKSTYQFIESQTNLLCLLHEVRTATMVASSKLIEIQRAMTGQDRDELDAEMGQIRKDQEYGLTEDLKEKVGEVERQWDEALGKEVEACKDRVKEWLQETGGWDEGLEE